MHRPIAVFDAGIGSYTIVAEIKKTMPRQDIVYLADRKLSLWCQKSTRTAFNHAKDDRLSQFV